MTFAAGAAAALGAFQLLYPLQQSLGLELRQQGTVSDTGTLYWLKDHAERPAAKLHSFIHYTLSRPQIRCTCVAADILWQPSSLPCLGISSTM